MKCSGHSGIANGALETAPLFTPRKRILPYFIFCLLIHSFRFFSEDVISLIDVSTINISLLSMYIVLHTLAKWSMVQKTLQLHFWSPYTSALEIICDAKISIGVEKIPVYSIHR